MGVSKVQSRLWRCENEFRWWNNGKQHGIEEGHGDAGSRRWSQGERSLEKKDVGQEG